MKIEHWKHEKVMPDGICLNEFNEPHGNVYIGTSIRMSSDNGGCGIDNCHCSDGHWLSICFGRDDETESVSGITIWFDNYGEMQLFLTLRELYDNNN